MGLHTASCSPVAPHPTEAPGVGAGPASWERNAALCSTPQLSRPCFPGQNLPCFSRSMW